MDALVEAVKMHALEHYNDAGWDVVIECWTDDELRAWLEVESPDGTLAVATTEDEAIKKMAFLVDIWAEQQAEHDRRWDI